MNKLILLLPLLTASALAQSAGPAQANPLSTWLRDAYTGIAIPSCEQPRKCRRRIIQCAPAPNRKCALSASR